MELTKKEREVLSDLQSAAAKAMRSKPTLRILSSLMARGAIEFDPFSGTVLPMLVMLISGLSLGAGGSTLYWSSRMDRQFTQQAQWKAMVDKQGVTIREQSDALRNLTAATQRLMNATR